MATRLLFPMLPPELRDVTYTQLTQPSNPSTNAGLPFSRKIYDSSHTRVEIAPFHHGDLGLLALQHYRYLEGDEYAKWVLANGITLRITILFKGHVDTFIQEHWDKKIGAHLKNLVKKYPWMHKVSHYEVKVLWRPRTWTTGRKQKRLGAIAKQMVRAVTQEMDPGVRLRKGVIEAKISVARWVVMDYRAQGQAMGLGEFFGGLEVDWAKEQVWEVGVAVDEEGAAETSGYLPSQFRTITGVAATKDEDRREHRIHLVCRHEVQTNQNGCVTFFRNEEDGRATTQQAMLAVVDEIAGSGLANTDTKIQP